MPLRSTALVLVSILLSGCVGPIPEGATSYGYFSSDFPDLTAAYAATAVTALERPCTAGSAGGAAGVRVTATTTELGLTNTRISHVRTC